MRYVKIPLDLYALVSSDYDIRVYQKEKEKGGRMNHVELHAQITFLYDTLSYFTFKLIFYFLKIRYELGMCTLLWVSEEARK